MTSRHNMKNFVSVTAHGPTKWLLKCIESTIRAGRLTSSWELGSLGIVLGLKAPYNVRDKNFRGSSSGNHGNYLRRREEDSHTSYMFTNFGSMHNS